MATLFDYHKIVKCFDKISMNATSITARVPRSLHSIELKETIRPCPESDVLIPQISRERRFLDNSQGDGVNVRVVPRYPVTGLVLMKSSRERSC